MRQETEAKTILVVDSSYKTFNEAGHKIKDVEVYFASQGHIAQDFLRNSEVRLDGILLNPNVERPCFKTIIPTCHRSRPSIPIYCLLDEEENLNKDIDLGKLGVQNVVQKPLDYKKIYKILNPADLDIDYKALNKIANKYSDSVGAEHYAEFDKFKPLIAKNFLSGHKSVFDVYIRLNEDKFIKVLQAGETFIPEQLERYLKTGMTHFYIRSEAQKYYVDYCSKLANKLLDHPEVTENLKVATTLNVGEEVVSFLKTNGVSDSSLEYAKSYATSVASLTKTLRSDDSLVKKYLNSLSEFDVAAGAAVIAGLIAKDLNIDSKKSHEVIGVASVLQNIGMYAELDDFAPGYYETEFFSEEFIEEKLNEELILEKKRVKYENIYYEHPGRGSVLVSKINNINPLISQIVLQHHFKRGGGGFPDTISSANIHLFAEIIGVSTSFLKIIKNSKLDNGDGTGIDLRICFNKLFKDYSNMVTRSLMKVVFGHTRKNVMS